MADIKQLEVNGVTYDLKANLYVAEYGVTTYAEINQHLSDGYVIFAKKDAFYYNLIGKDSLNNKFKFSCPTDSSQVLTCSVSTNNSWSYSNFNIVNKVNGSFGSVTLDGSKLNVSSSDSTKINAALSNKLEADDVTPVLQSGQKIAEIGGKNIYAPAGGGGGATPVKKVSRTLTEAVTDLQITTDDNGNTLNISHWKALVYLPNSSSYTGNIIMYPCPYPFPDFSFRPSSNDGSAVNTMFAESVGDEFITFGYGIYGNSSDTYALKNIKYRNSNVNMTMTKFQLVTWTSGNAIPVGTKVEIWDLGW